MITRHERRKEKLRKEKEELRVAVKGIFTIFKILDRDNVDISFDFMALVLEELPELFWSTIIKYVHPEKCIDSLFKVLDNYWQESDYYLAIERFNEKLEERLLKEKGFWFDSDADHEKCRDEYSEYQKKQE